MKIIQNLFDKARPMFEKGGKLHSLYYLWEATESFFFLSPKKTVKGSHIRDAADVKRLMSFVVVALLPAIIFGMYNIGLQHYISEGLEPYNIGIIPCFFQGFLVLIPLYIVVFAVGGFWEILFAVVRKHEINEGFIVTTALIPLIVPPTLPLWQLVIATSFGVVLGKEVFGGTGMNIFNPALLVRAFLFFAYPKEISGNSVWVKLGSETFDGFSGATPLSVVADNSANLTGISPVQALTDSGVSFMDMFLGFIPGSIGETSTLMILLGAIVLIVTKVGSWRVMCSVFVGGFLMGLVMNAVAPSESSFLALPAHYHLVMGGFAFGAVFMATDPVSSAQTNTGKYIYGFLIGVFAVIIRTLNPAYPEGMMLSILFFNAFAPLFDYFVIEANKKRRLRYAKS